MNNRKLKLIYDVESLKNGYWPSSSRSGIFFVALNILKGLAKRRDIDLTLTCTPFSYAYVQYVLNQEIPDIQFNFRINSRLATYCGKIKLLKRIASRNKEYFRKIILQILFLIISPLTRLMLHFNSQDNFEDFGAYLSPVFLIPKSIKARKYTLVHDIIPLKFEQYRSEKWQQGFWLYDLCQTLNQNDNYFANSESTRKDFLKYFPQINPANITTTLLACDDKFKPVALEKIKTVKNKYGIPANKKYVFSLCSLEPRKNLERSVTTFVQFLKKNNIDDLVFVLGGGHWDSFIQKIEKAIDSLGDYKKTILKIGYVADDDLPALYSGAEWFTYTSAYEGFGLPALEAMSCGCPLIVSNNSSLPEVVGDAGISIDWDSDQQHIEAYERYYFNLELRRLNREKGLTQAKKFSWAACVDKMIEKIKRDMN